MKISHTGLERWTICSYKDCESQVKLWWVWARERKKNVFFCNVYNVRRVIFWQLCFILINSVLNKLSEYIYFYISKTITLYTFVTYFKIVENLQCILKLLFLYLNWLSIWSKLGSVIFKLNKCLHILHIANIKLFSRIT